MVLTQCACIHKGIITGLREASAHFDGHPDRESPGKDGKTRLKMVTRSTQDTKKMQDVRVDTIAEL